MPSNNIKNNRLFQRAFNSHKTQITAIAFLRQQTVLSSVDSDVICYDVSADSYKIYNNLSGRNPITLFAQSPKDDNLVALGTKDGLILLLSCNKMVITAKLRGQDTQICSLDWFSVPKSAQKSIHADTPLKSLMEDSAGDCFDIYEDNRQMEFGVSQEDCDGSSAAKEQKGNNENFDFLEACKSLKKDIQDTSEIQSNSDNSMDNKPFNTEPGTCPSKEQIMQMNNIEKYQSEDGESMESNASTGSPSDATDSEGKEFVIVSKDDVKDCDEVAMLASGSREQAVWIWNIDEKLPMGKITWHPKKHAILPDPFTNVLWMNEKTLLVTDGNGELAEHEISYDFKANKITSNECKQKKFNVQGVLNVCKTVDSSLIWVSSIHRRIICVDYKTCKNVMSLDSLQLRIHYLIENPFDSNVVAIAGNDRRICVWNTSILSDTEISLRPFMNKIKSCVLCLSWHPEKENLLAFSTREGRIGIMDVNKSTNVPEILPSFTSKEVYSIAWAKKNDELVLLACDRQKFVFYNHKRQWEKNYVDAQKRTSSIAVKGKFVVLGNEYGEIVLCDIDDRFNVVQKRQVSKKYVGSMVWSGEMLAVATESNFQLFKKFTAEPIADDDVLTFETNSRINDIRFSKSGKLIVTASNDGLVKVWDIEKCEMISSFALESAAFTAMFLPSNEDFVMCGGQETTVDVFDSRLHNDTNSKVAPINKNKKKKDKSTRGVEWAKPTEITVISQNSKKRQKSKVEVQEKTEDAAIEEDLAGEVQKITLTAAKKCPTIFAAANRELTVNPIEFMMNILKCDSDESRTLSFNEQIFGDRAQIKRLLESESEY